MPFCIRILSVTTNGLLQLSSASMSAVLLAVPSPKTILVGLLKLNVLMNIILRCSVQLSYSPQQLFCNVLQRDEFLLPGTFIFAQTSSITEKAGARCQARSLIPPSKARFCFLICQSIQKNHNSIIRKSFAK